MNHLSKSLPNMNTKTKLDDATVVRKLAERGGWKPAEDGCGGFSKDHGTDKDGWTSISFRSNERMARLLTSRDDLAPILEGLSEDEWDRLAINVLPRIYHEKHPLRPVSVSRFLLTLPPRDLAYAIAEIL
jgi:hypothetical protein